MAYTPPYNTVAEIQRRTGISGNSNISTTSINTKITISDGIVDGYIIDRYSLPLSSTCSVLKELAGEIAEALILREEYGPEIADTDKDGQNKYENAISILNSVKTGSMKLLTDSNPRSEFAVNAGTLPTSYPNNASDILTTTLSTAPKFRVGDTY